ISKSVLTRLMNPRRGWQSIGSWSDVPIELEVRGDTDAFYVTLALGDSQEEWTPKLAINQSWIAGKQQGRIAKEIHAFFEELPERIERAATEARHHDRRAEEYEAQSRQPFAKAEELRRLLARKLALDAYISSVATGQETSEELRKQLLEE